MSLNQKSLMLVLSITLLIDKIAWSTEFNLETHTFSKLDSIKEWIHPHFIPYINIVQKIISEEMLNNQEALKKNRVIHNIINNDGDTRFYGKTFPILPIPTTILLKTIKDLVEQDPQLMLLEVGGADGLIPLLMIFAMGPEGTLIYNDLSKYEIEKGKERFKEVVKITNFPIQKIIFDIGDAKEFSKRLPYENKIALVHIQNVEHFMNPTEHPIFVEQILTMVSQTGYVIASAHTIPKGYGIKGNPFFDEYIKLKQRKILYPMFLKHTEYLKQLGGEYTKLQIMLPYTHKEKFKVHHPEDNTICSSTGEPIETVKETFKNKEINCHILKLETLLNYFTPTIYNNAYITVAQEKDLRISQDISGFITSNGEKFFKDFDNNKDISFTLTVFRKL